MVQGKNTVFCAAQTNPAGGTKTSGKQARSKAEQGGREPGACRSLLIPGCGGRAPLNTKGVNMNRGRPNAEPEACRSLLIPGSGGRAEGEALYLPVNS